MIIGKRKVGNSAAVSSIHPVVKAGTGEKNPKPLVSVFVQNSLMRVLPIDESLTRLSCRINTIPSINLKTKMAEHAFMQPGLVET